jgi:hypothetical protein
MHIYTDHTSSQVTIQQTRLCCQSYVDREGKSQGRMSLHTFVHYTRLPPCFLFHRSIILRRLLIKREEDIYLVMAERLLRTANKNG